MLGFHIHFFIWNNSIVVNFFTCFVCKFFFFNCFAVYEAGKAVKKGIATQYAPTLYAPSVYSHPPYSGINNQSSIPMLPLPVGARQHYPQNGLPSLDHDGASSGEDNRPMYLFLY